MIFAAILEEGNHPRECNHQIQRPISRYASLLQTQMTIPGECHKHIAHNEQQDSINSVCHFFNTSLTITAAKLQKKFQSTSNRLEFFYIHPKAFCRMRHTVLSNLPLGYAAWLIQECTQHRKFTEKKRISYSNPTKYNTKS